MESPAAGKHPRILCRSADFPPLIKISRLEHLYWMEMNPDGVGHKAVYRCGEFVVGLSLTEAPLQVKRVARVFG
jgi:hypothetical protein